MEDPTTPQTVQVETIVETQTQTPTATAANPEPFQNQYQVAMRDEIAVQTRRLNSGANWFNWIAGLSMLNTLIYISGSHWNFLAGLGSTMIVTVIATAPKLNLGTAGLVIAVVFNLIISGILVLFALFAKKRHSWAFLVGMILYAVDGLIVLLVRDGWSIAFHAFALYSIFRGFQACRQISEMESDIVTSRANRGFGS